MGGPVGGFEVATERPQVVEAGGPDAQLPRVGPTVGRHRHRLAAPDQLGAALAEALPAAPDEVGRPAVVGAVPPLHRQDRPPVADPAPGQPDRFEAQRPGQRTVELERLVDRELDTELGEAVQQRVAVAQLAHLDHRVGHDGDRVTCSSAVEHEELRSNFP